MGVDKPRTSLPLFDEGGRSYEHPLYDKLLSMPGLSVGVAPLDRLLTWGLTNSLWVFPMATSCCGIELMAAAASRVDLDRMGTFYRGTPRQGDVMVVAGTITVKMAPRVKRLWEQMPEPKWAIAMGSCAISGDFYRDLYPVVPGIDTFLPVDVYIPGCPPNPESLMAGLLELAAKIRSEQGKPLTAPVQKTGGLVATKPSIARIGDPERDPSLSDQQMEAASRAAESPVARPAEELEMPPVPETAPGTVAAPPTFAPELVELFQAHGVVDFPKDAPPVVPLARHVALARALVERGYKQLVYVVASHWLAGKGRSGNVAGGPEHHEVAYGLRTVGPKRGAEGGSKLAWWSVRVEAGGAAPTLAHVIAGADWQEREQWDLVGVRFSGHPDLRRLMMPDDWSGHPLRKDYPADAHTAPWR
ncbi:MAG: NADH-quinone oxidoreductase subunit NuoB [Sandaracinaceae bacterium]|nr:NADH-quinone oxidoreductase subunit NuoB [Sandaracinaceae bacterium]